MNKVILSYIAKTIQRNRLQEYRCRSSSKTITRQSDDRRKWARPSEKRTSFVDEPPAARAGRPRRLRTLGFGVKKVINAGRHAVVPRRQFAYGTRMRYVEGPRRGTTRRQSSGSRREPWAVTQRSVLRMGVPNFWLRWKQIRFF
ncbi:hypothetical protein EVAR_41135_1 [Eumeta japonica]|uniref:Uncharacterized protein n=1 Tax=Eumeta variegata TaxID=151549 RepID=A0A4C1YE38_EUMVA|nr:hypothetical protein EVAR_41135_1 [Eumeta japonica]